MRHAIRVQSRLSAGGIERCVAKLEPPNAIAVYLLKKNKHMLLPQPAISPAWLLFGIKAKS